MATASLSTKKLSLPAELFYDAMERQLPLADYARNIDLHPDMLRQALAGRLKGADSDPLNALAKAMKRDPEQLELAALPCGESFSMWLKRNMEGMSQHGLRARAQLDSQTLKRFLNGDLLPDSDQAERISRALYIDRMEIARVVTASMAAAPPALASQESAEPKVLSHRTNMSIESGASTAASQLLTGTRRRRASLRDASAEPASSLAVAAPATIDETASATGESDTAALADAPIAEKRRKRASKPQIQLTEAYPASQPAAPAAVDQAEVLAPPAPAETVTEKPAGAPRPKRPTTRSLAAVAAAQQTPALSETEMAADGKPLAEPTVEDRSSAQASSRRRPRTIEPPEAASPTSANMPPSVTAEIAAPKPDQRSADIGIDPTVPLVTAEIAPDTTSLQLSADEVRLIRHWRQLHPHGRRATLQYIGSLLVDD